MKKLYLLLFLFAFLFTKAQTDFRFADSTAQWNVMEKMLNYGNGQAKIITEKLTLDGELNYGGKMYQGVRSQGFLYHKIRQDSLKQVWLIPFNDTAEHLIYDFGLSVNDTVRVYDAFTTHSYSVVCRVDSVDLLMLDKPRKRMFLSCGNSLNALYHPDVWVLGVGSLNSYMLNPGVDSIMLPNSELWLETLLCFEEKSQLLYFNAQYNSCDIDSNWVEVTGIPFVSNVVTVVVRAGILEVTLSEVSQGVGKCYLYDLTGRLLLQKPLTEQTTRIDLSALAKGVYLYELVSDKQRIKSGKLLVE